MANRQNRKSGKNRREQKPKNTGNEGWMRARLDHSNRNLTVPSGKAYRRPSPGSKEF